ncbi:MAG: MATE family efflux transporter [Prolixibacteraceae bacterium]
MVSAKLKRIYHEIKLSLRGEDQDYTQGNLKRAVFLLSVPMVLEMMMESIFAIVDIFFVSRLGADAIATVGLTESVITIIYALAVGLSAAASALVSRRVGEGNLSKASNSAYQAILTGICLSVILAVPGAIYAKDILIFMNASSDIVNKMSGYTSIMFGGNVVIMLLFINNAIFRSAGNPVLSMRVLWFANIINLILDPLFIFGWGPVPAMGIKGAAIATTIGRGLAVIYQFYLLRNGDGRIKLKGINYRPDFNLIGKLLKLSTGSVSQYIVATSSWVILMRIVAQYGSDVLAAYTISIRIIVFALLPAWGIGNATSTLVGQNLGAGQADRAEQSAWLASKANMVTMGFVAILLQLFPGFLIGLFTDNPNIIEVGISSLRTISVGLVFYGLGMTLVNVFNGSGDTQTPFRINIICFWMIEIPLAWLLSGQFGFEQQGVFMSIVVADVSMTAIVYHYFKKEKWKLKMV